VALPYPAFPSPEATLTADGALDDFARAMALDALPIAAPGDVAAHLRRAMADGAQPGERRAQAAAAALRPCFVEANRALAARGVDATWTWFYTATGARNGVAWRWYRVTAAERAASERAGALTAEAFARNLAARTSAAVVFYALLAAAWARGSTPVYAAAFAAFATYLVLRWRLPLRPR
jgi:hypothetical protein